MLTIGNIPILAQSGVIGRRARRRPFTTHAITDTYADLFQVEPPIPWNDCSANSGIETQSEGDQSASTA